MIGPTGYIFPSHSHLTVRPVHAVLQDRPACVSLLLHTSIGRQETGGGLDERLLEAAATGDADAVRTLLRQGAKIGATNAVSGPGRERREVKKGAVVREYEAGG